MRFRVIVTLLLCLLLPSVSTNAQKRRSVRVPAEILPACIEPPSQLAAWWPFNEPSGTVAADLAGTHHAAHQNGPTPVPGKVGKALAFDGVDSYASVPHDASLDFGSQFSFDFWIRPNAGETTGTIYRKGAPAAGPPFLGGPGFHLLYNNGHLLGGFIGASNAFYTDFTPSLTGHITPGGWTFVALTIDLAGGPSTLYINGEPVQTQTIPSNIGSLANTEPVIIGGTDESSPSPDRSFGGALDELEFFNRILTPAEIEQLAFAGSAGKCGSPSCSGPEEFRHGFADGMFAFYPDEAGAMFGCSGGSGNASASGIRFNPAGPLPEANVNCSTMLYVFDQAGTHRQVLSVHATAKNSCTCDNPNITGPCFYEPLCKVEDHAHLTCGDVTSDSGVFYLTPSQKRRITEFTLPNFPGLSVQLVQDLYLDRFEQTYRFTNKTAQPYDLRISRVADADVGYLDGSPSPDGYTNNFSSIVTFGAEIHDNDSIATLEVTAPEGNGSDAKYEGARLQGNGGSAHGRTWWNYGVPPGLLDTYAVDLNYWNAKWEGNPPKQGEADQAVVIQSLVTVPPGQTKSYITVTRVK